MGILEEPDKDPFALKGSQRVFTTQLGLCLWIGMSSFTLFCILRYRWPHIYAVRTLRNRATNIKSLPTSFFGWVKEVFYITDDEVLAYSGLDAYVFLTFFRMGMKIFIIMSVFAIFVLSPIRLYNTGNYDKENIIRIIARLVTRSPIEASTSGEDSDTFPKYLWSYPFFTYLFSAVVFYCLYEYTDRVIKTRQKYLASQNSIVDRTIRLDAIPENLIGKNDPTVLKRFIENLGIGKVTDVKLVYDWSPLEKLFSRRAKILRSLEEAYSSVFGLNIDIYDRSKVPSVSLNAGPVNWELPRNAKYKMQIDELRQDLADVNNQIKSLQSNFDDNTSTIRNNAFKQIPSAFITMDSVASAQMAAQAVLDPRVYKFIVNLAPAPKDIEWSSFRLSPLKKICKSYFITLIIILSYILLFFPVSSLATLLNLKTITKFWPSLGEFIGKSRWLTTFVTGILPPLLFSLLNISLPYFYKYLSSNQGYPSNSDVELSTLSKNFFYIFFNLFLVFTVTGTVSNYWSFLSDTTKIAYQLASSLKRLSLFYVDLILLQGLAMFPVRLLQIGDVVFLNIIGKMFLLKRIILKTPRDYRFHYYTPPIFDFGLQLPQHILMFMIILIYSVVSTKIVTSGLVYFILGYFVYKYQLIYTCVHPPHSTGRVWIMIFRRLMLGLILFQLFMTGTLALEGAFVPSASIVPLSVITLIFVWNFEKYYVPLNSFIALRAIQNPIDFDKDFYKDGPARSMADTENEDNIDDVTETSLLVPESPNLRRESDTLLRRRKSTLDEEREQFLDYTYPRIKDPLNGPWLGFEGDYICFASYGEDDTSDALENGALNYESSEGLDCHVIRKKLRLSEWE
ncbi:Piso0_003218 [Millerozyma farinosa CBS 7064]|uniref:Piso0_003218 protein n=1 Tax=Pichia sorbitophila (strain ATCC MYA-4447 / BCRC 22081 / CBS 7064 / NBRC 10061 / NRRL Y-12695) TaxID=559304 RepID=G8YHI2_PICSO|nr:Piso0_003218 [Millerozyma farinosa CBS 7064]CCE80884.1 Piso0_003218 [Millerozyma farinosa CBS 7064]